MTKSFKVRLGIFFIIAGLVLAGGAVVRAYPLVPFVSDTLFLKCQDIIPNIGYSYPEYDPEAADGSPCIIGSITCGGQGAYGSQQTWIDSGYSTYIDTYTCANITLSGTSQLGHACSLAGGIGPGHDVFVSITDAQVGNLFVVGGDDVIVPHLLHENLRGNITLVVG